MDLEKQPLPDGYAFHEPRFVTWWLGSLHLFPPQDQIGIATALRGTLHNVAVQEEIDAFIALTAQENGLAAAEQDADALDGSPGEDKPRAALAMYKQLFGSHPWLVVLGTLGVLVLVLKGLLGIARGLFSVVF